MHLKVFLDLKFVSIKTTSIAKENFFSKKKIHLYSICNVEKALILYVSLLDDFL